jgi:hypothetical protein
MPFLLPFFLFIPLVIMCHHASGTPSDRYSKVINVKAFYPGKTKNDAPDTRIFKELAKENLKDPWKVNLHFSAVVSWQIIGKSVDSISIEVDSVQVSGDTLFRGFSLSRVLIPSSIRLVIRIANATDTTNYTRQEFQMVTFSDSVPFFYRTALRNFDPTVDTLLFEQLTLQFTEADWVGFNRYTKLIHDYYAAALILDSVQSMARNVNPLAMDQLSVNYFKIYEINKVLNLLSSISFSDILTSGEHDHLRLRERFQDSYRTGRTLTYTFLDAIAGRLPPQGNISEQSPVAWMYMPSQRVSAWIDRSQWMDQLQSTLYKRFLDQFFEGEPFPEENRVTLRWLEKMYPSAGKDSLLTFYSNSVYHNILAKAEYCIRSNDHARAVALLECAQQFARQFKDVADTIRGTALLTRANEGVFSSFVSIADGCIDRGNQEMAVTFLEKADQFRMVHPDYIIDDALYRKTYSRLFFIRNSRCDQLLGESRFADALDCYETLIMGFPEKELVLLSDSLNDRMDQAREGIYLETAGLAMQAIRENRPSEAIELNSRAEILRKEMTTGSARVGDLHQAIARDVALIEMDALFRLADSAMEKRQFTLAVSLFGSVKKMATENQFGLPEGFDSLFQRSMKQYLLINLSSKQRKIWKNEFDSASMAISYVRDSMARYHLDQDPDLNLALLTFERKIQDRKCALFSDSVDFQLIVATKKIKMNQYIQACRIFSEVADRMNGMRGCSLEGRSPGDSLKKYIDAAAYQQMVDSVSTMIVIGKYAEACRILLQSENFYQANQILSFGIEIVAVEQFLRERNNLYLTVAALDHFMEYKELEMVVRFLLMAKDQNSPSELLQQQQENTGKLIAVMENEQIPVPENAKQLLYTTDRFWKTLQLSYKKQAAKFNQH